MRFRPVVGAILSPLLLASAARGEVVERILAVVGDRPLMLSEVRLVQQLRGLERAPALEALVDEQLMLREASRLAQSAVSEEDEQRAYESLLRRVPNASVLPESDLRRVVRRQAAILKYVEYRFRPDRKSTRLNSRPVEISYAVFCLKKKKTRSHLGPGAARTSRNHKVWTTCADR